jgi:hypothetical protein
VLREPLWAGKGSIGGDGFARGAYVRCEES